MPVCISSLRLFFASSTAAVLFSKFEPTLASHERKDDETTQDDLKRVPDFTDRTSRDAKWIRDEKLLGTRVISQDRPLNSEIHKQDIASAFDASAPATERLRNMSPPHKNGITGRSCDPDVGVLSCGDGEDCRRDPSQDQGGVCVPKIGVAQEDHRRLGFGYGTVDCDAVGAIRLDVYIMKDGASYRDNSWNVKDSDGNDVVQKRDFPSSIGRYGWSFSEPVDGYFCITAPDDGDTLTLTLYDEYCYRCCPEPDTCYELCFDGNGIYGSFDATTRGLSWSQEGETDPIVSLCNSFFDRRTLSDKDSLSRFQTCIEFDAGDGKFLPCAKNKDPCFDGCIACRPIRGKNIICQDGITRKIVTKTLAKSCAAGATCGACPTSCLSYCPPDINKKVAICEKGRNRLVSIKTWESFCTYGGATCGPCY